MIRTSGPWPNAPFVGPGDENRPASRARATEARAERSPRGSTLLGVVICGGRSRRMGRDKAPLEVGGRSMLDATREAFAGVTERVLLACGSRERYRDSGCELVLDRVPDAGPLAGLEAALARGADAGEPGAWMLVLACDMPRARAEVFTALLARARERGADACLLRSPRGVEPLYAVYHTRCQAAVRRALDAGERRMTSFHEGYGELTMAFLDEDELPAALVAHRCARNVNTPHELEEEREARA